MLAVLRQRNFALLWFGQLISVFGDWVLLIALPFYIFDVTGSALATGAMFIAQTVPRVLLGSFAGVFVDRWNRKRTMIATDVLRAALLLLLLAVRSADWLPLIYGVAFFQAVIAQFFVPAKNAVIPLLVSERDLIPANALNSLSENLTRLTAPALGGALFGLLGLRSVVLVDSASFLLSALAIALIVVPVGTRAAANSNGASWRAAWGEWRDGLCLIRSVPTITAVFAAMGTAMIAEGIFLVMLVPFVKIVLHGGAQDFGWLASAQAVGGLVGSAVIGRLGKVIRPAILIPSCGFLFGLCDVALALAPGHLGLAPLVTALVMIGLAGAPIVGFFIGLQALLQGSVADQYRGRVFGAFSTIVALMTLCGQGIGSALGDRVGVVPLIALAGCFDILASGVAFVFLRRASGSTMVPQESARPIVEEATLRG